MRKVLSLVLAAPLLAMPHATLTQTDDMSAQNAKKARALLDAMVQALGGSAWLNIKNQMQHGHVAAFFRGKPDPGTTELWRLPSMARPGSH